jgi:hypothetical protein
MEGDKPDTPGEDGLGAALMQPIAVDGTRPEQEEDSAPGGAAWEGAGSWEIRIG